MSGLELHPAAMELSRVIGAQHVSVERSDPLMVRAEPQNAEEVAYAIGSAGRHGLIVVPVGTGSRPGAGQAVPTIVIGTSRLNQIVQIDDTSLTAHVQAGVTGMALEEALEVRGLSIGDYPPAVLASTLGGLVAVRTPGKSSARHGFFEDAVLGVSAVLADGRFISTRVAPRRATGPDLGRTLCGSEGTLGLITSVILRVHRRAESRLFAAYALPSIEHAVSAVYLALREEAMPAGLRIYDEREARVHFGDVLGAADGALIVACAAGPTDLATADRNLITSAATAEGGRELSSDVAEAWWQRIHGEVETPGPAPTLQVMAAPSRLRSVYRAVLAAGAGVGAEIRAHISRFDADGAVVFFTAVGGDSSQVTTAIRNAAEQSGGWLLGARATALDPYLRALRQGLDPKARMNPDALVGDSLSNLELGA